MISKKDQKIEVLESSKKQIQENLQEKEIESEKKSTQIYEMEDQISNLNSNLSQANERVIKLDNDNINFQDRIQEKNHELERLKGELSVMERMVQKIDIGRGGDPHQQRKVENFRNSNFKRREEIKSPETEFYSRNERKIESQGDVFQNFRNDERKEFSARKINNYRGRREGESSPGQKNKISNEMERPKKYFKDFVVGGKEEQLQKNKMDAKAIAKANMQGTGNFMTWDNPYESKKKISFLLFV